MLAYLYMKSNSDTKVISQSNESKKTKYEPAKLDNKKMHLRTNLGPLMCSELSMAPRKNRNLGPFKNFSP